jgi:hypothetical protein
VGLAADAGGEGAMASSGIGVLDREVSFEVEFPVDVVGRPSSLSSDGNEKF